MRSFDFYDTLVTRLVATPADIFSLVGERLAIPEFREMRIAAEVAARRAHGGEVTFDEIYEHVPLPTEVRNKAWVLEYEFERSLVAPIAAILSQFQTGDLIVSDMYHDERLYREVLSRLVPTVVPGMVMISGTAKINKASGELWKSIARTYPAHQSHVGDNMLADVRQARKNGLVAEHYSGATLNRYEAALARQGGDGSVIAGVSRATRLALIGSDCPAADAATIAAFASVVAPVLHSFAHWVVRTCADEGVRDIYFLARDGQLPFRICSRLVADSGLALRCHYIFASRQALHLPGCQSVENAESWLLEDTPHLSLRIIAERACVPLEVVLAASQARIAIGPDENIPTGKRRILRDVIADQRFVAAFESRIKQAFDPALAYYLNEGLGQGGDIAVVDVGWNGRLQRSLGTLLEKAGQRPARMLGLYLCLSRRLSSAPGDDLRGFVADPERPHWVKFFDRYRHVFEAALSADHPTTIGFEFRNGQPQPIPGPSYPATTERKIGIQHATLNAFMENLGAVGRAAGRPVRPATAAAIRNFVKYLSRPTPEDGHAFDGFWFVDGQSGTDARPMSRIITAADLFRPSLDLGYWPEGTLSASGFGFLNRPRNRIRWLLDRGRSGLSRSGVVRLGRRLAGR
jgi:hypothetical protein